MKRASHPSVLSVESGAARGGTGPSIRRSVAFAAEASSHVLKEDAAVRLAQMQENALRVLRGQCGECGNTPKQGDKLLFGAIVPVAKEGRLGKQDVYIVPLEQLSYIKDVTVTFKDEIQVCI